MEFKYQKIKKLDIKKWLQGGNSKIYLIILVVFLAAVIFALTSIKELSKNSQSNNNITPVSYTHLTLPTKLEV